jgi:transcription elongation factor GreA
MAETQQHHLSQAAYDRLKAELEELTTVGRINIARKIEVAREMGDLSENGDYHAAKEEQGKMEARIGHLNALVERAVIIDEDGPLEAVQQGCVVTIVYEGDDDEEQYLIGSIEERRDGVEIVSPTSPLGEALLGAKPGEAVTYDAPNGSLTVEIIRIER